MKTDPFTWKPWCTQQMAAGRNDRLIKTEMEKRVYYLKKKKKSKKLWLTCKADTSFNEELSLINVEGLSDFSSEQYVPGHVWAGIFSLG